MQARLHHLPMRASYEPIRRQPHEGRGDATVMEEDECINRLGLENWTAESNMDVLHLKTWPVFQCVYICIFLFVCILLKNKGSLLASMVP